MSGFLLYSAMFTVVAVSMDTNAQQNVLEMTDLVQAYQIGSRVCKGQTCEQTLVLEERNEDPIDNICYRICQAENQELYARECDCSKYPVDESLLPCTTSYLENALCKWTNESCSKTEAYCLWRKNKALSIIANQKITTCDCELKETTMQKPCDWKSSEEALCSLLKENKLLEADFECSCDTSPPKPGPGERNACLYSASRPAQLDPWRQKRLFASSTAIACNYPGVVGIFYDVGNENFRINMSCTATLLDAETVLFDTQCNNLMAEPMHALVDSYDTKNVKASKYRVKVDTIQPLDKNYGGNSLYTAKLNTRVVYDEKCVQPACVPNRRIPAHYVDLNDCRVLGYGDTTNEVFVGPSAPKLREIRVMVDPSSVTKELLQVSREDGVKNTACMRDFSAPVVCAHKYTKEWITLGVHRYAGPICSGERRSNVYEIVNLLGESKTSSYFDHLKPYFPAPRSEL